MSDPRTVRLQDYTPPAFLVDRIALRFELDPHATTVHSTLTLRRNPDAADGHAPLQLDGAALELVELRLDGEVLDPGRYRLQDEALVITQVPECAELQVTTRIDPAGNTSLEGLYRAESAYCTQCEAEGFRKITYFPDRPDVMAVYTTTLVADPASCPVLLSNGNPVASGQLDDGRHWVTWEDPFPKPSYLFALVAGDLEYVEDSFTTASGREVNLRIYVERHNIDACDHAMQALKKAMAWDEQRFGLEYDLDRYMIVAVDDFNMGAMENKGLNVFNSRYVLARPQTATDTDFANIEAVVAHEYFHNWTGNRVTCRDWFQLSLKEGLTVFRDQLFSADQGSAAVRRIQDVRVLRTAQFAEDAGPMAHPVRPDEYIEINNFYTVTVYNKGAEVIRMIHTLIGEQAFRRGMDLYFQRHDGQAVTTDDFVQAMQDASGKDLGLFRRWYVQAGTPEVDIKSRHDAARGELRLTLRQSCPATPGQPRKDPFHVPLALGLLDAEDGSPVVPHIDAGAAPRRGEHGSLVLELCEAEQQVVLKGVEQPVVVSALRGFSAPVKLRQARSSAELTFLFGHDPDPFNRWDAGQTLFMDTLLAAVRAHQAGEPPQVPGDLVEAVRRTLTDTRLDDAFIAEAIGVPSETYIAEQLEVVDVEAVHVARRTLRQTLAAALHGDLQAAHRRCHDGQAYRFDAAAAGRRALGNAALGLLLALDDDTGHALALEQYRSADNMTDSLAALTALASSSSPERDAVLAHFESRWRRDSLVMDKWLSVQATARRDDALQVVEALLAHTSFDLRKPNKVRALIGAFCHGNPLAFHAADGAGYRFARDRILELDPLNPQVTARLAGAFGRWRRFDEPRRGHMQACLQSILDSPGLSRDSYEVVSKTLGDEARTR